MTAPLIANQFPPRADTPADQNLALLHALVRAQLADPEGCTPPDGVQVVFIPEDDSALRRHNLALASAALDAGQRVYLLPAAGPFTAEASLLLERVTDLSGHPRVAATLPMEDNLAAVMAMFTEVQRRVSPMTTRLREAVADEELAAHTSSLPSSSHIMQATGRLKRSTPSSHDLPGSGA